MCVCVLLAERENCWGASGNAGGVQVEVTLRGCVFDSSVKYVYWSMDSAGRLLAFRLAFAVRSRERERGSRACHG